MVKNQILKNDLIRPSIEQKRGSKSMLILYLKTSLCEVEVGWGYEEEKQSGPDKTFFNEVHVQDLDLCSKSLTKSTLNDNTSV